MMFIVLILSENAIAKADKFLEFFVGSTRTLLTLDFSVLLATLVIIQL